MRGRPVRAAIRRARVDFPEPPEPTQDVPASLVSTAYSSQDGPEPAESSGGGNPVQEPGFLHQNLEP